MNHISLTGVVTKSHGTRKHEHQGAQLTFHVADSTEVFDDVWFIVMANGKLAERLTDDIWAGQIVTVFGRIRMPNQQGNGAILVHAKEIVAHILEEADPPA